VPSPSALPIIPCLKVLVNCFAHSYLGAFAAIGSRNPAAHSPVRDAHLLPNMPGNDTMGGTNRHNKL
jgi:hypothetical protein